jgi:3-phenylpropionate/trans-cinnamate dioxygenase ferredoxin reductase component
MSAGVVIAGGGLAAQRCAETLRRAGHDGPIRMLCAERHRPYDRPPLSKAALAGDGADARLAFRPEAWYADHGVELLLGARAAALDARLRVVTLADGTRVGYEQLLIATGSRPRRLPELARFANVSTLRTVDDARALRAALRAGARVAIVGAGFIGQEVAAAAVRAGAHATLIEAADAPLQALLGARIGAWFAELHRAEGVDVHLGAQLAGADGDGRAQALVLADGRRVACDHVVVGVGVTPEVGWLAGSGLDGGGAGVSVDGDGRAAAPGVFAAGDAATAHDPLLRRRSAGGHWEAAGRQGARAARAMLGLPTGPAAVASFWSDLYDVRVQCVGHPALGDAAITDGDPAARDFSVTYTRGGTPVGVLLVGRPHTLPAARALLDP